MSSKYCCMLMRLAIDCKGCHKKLRRTILNMKEVETHQIERQYNRVSVCGRFRPSDVAIKIRRRMKRRVEILEIQEFDGGLNEQPPPPDHYPPPDHHQTPPDHHQPPPDHHPHPGYLPPHDQHPPLGYYEPLPNGPMVYPANYA